MAHRKSTSGMIVQSSGEGEEKEGEREEKEWDREGERGRGGESEREREMKKRTPQSVRYESLMPHVLQVNVCRDAQ